MNYYCLIAGLPDLHIESDKTYLPLAALKIELLEQISDVDAQLLKLVFAKFDNDNWLAYLQDKEAQLNQLGSLQTDDWNQLHSLMQEFDNPKDSRLLPYIHTFFTHYNHENFLEQGVSNEDYLSSLYYEFAMKSDNQFLRDWFEFSLNINNILTAIACRKHGFDVRTQVIGNNEVAQTLRSSNARDFGLQGIFEQLDTVLRIAEEPNLLSREKQIDALKWQWLDDHTFFNYFGVEKVLAFVLKSELIERWKPLTMEKGTEIFRELLGNLKEGVNFDESAE